MIKRKNKRGQVEKSKIFRTKPKKAQEEMLGFAVIIVVVAVILLIFLGFSLKKSQPQNFDNHKAQNFMQAFLQYSTDCGDNQEEFITIQDLIYDCYQNKRCSDGRSTCGVLESTLTEIVENVWKTGTEEPIKGYELNITLEGEDVFFKEEGNRTNNYKGAFEILPKKDIKVFFVVYS